jgi:hypothetical protein
MKIPLEKKQNKHQKKTTKRMKENISLIFQKPKSTRGHQGLAFDFF